MLALLTTSLLTSYGEYTYVTISNAKAKELMETNTIQSFIRHQGIIDLLKEDFNIRIEISNSLFEQQSGESALIFKLNNNFRLNTELNAEQIRAIGYNFGLLIKK